MKKIFSLLFALIISLFSLTCYAESFEVKDGDITKCGRNPSKYYVKYKRTSCYT